MSRSRRTTSPAGSDRRRPCQAGGWLVLAMGIVFAGIGCTMEERVIETRFGFEPSADRASQDRGGSTPTRYDEDGEWAVALGRFTGSDHQAEAERMARQIRDYADADSVWTGPDEGGTMIYSGRYASRGDPAAQADLRRWREFHRTGQMRLPALLLVPIGEDGRARQMPGDGDYNLENAADRGTYTLQIGIYDEDYGGDYRGAAEEAVAALREDGWEAYYWHGPIRSTISVGVWDESLWDDDSRAAREFQQVRRQFPHNSLNGLTIREDRDGRTQQQPSFPVHIPQP